MFKNEIQFIPVEGIQQEPNMSTAKPLMEFNKSQTVNGEAVDGKQ